MALDLNTLPLDAIGEFCRQNGILRLALFGSALRDDFGPNSDLDVLVEFKPGVRTGLAFFRMQNELSKLLGRTVDFNTQQCLSKYYRNRILKEARNLYVAA